MEYVLATGAFNHEIIQMIHSKGLVTHTVYLPVGSEEHTHMTYDLNQAQQVRDLLIKEGADPLKLRIQYSASKGQTSC